MKKFLLIAVIGLLSLTSSAQRFSTLGGNSGATLNYKNYAVTLAATDSISPDAFATYYVAAQLGGAKALTIKTNKAKKFDTVTILFSADGSGRVVTFTPTDNNAVVLWTLGTVTVAANKFATIVFMFDGTKWAEIARSVQT